MSTPDWVRDADREDDGAAEDHFGDEAPTRLMLKPIAVGVSARSVRDGSGES
jgi:hypothetical protein